MMPAKRWYAQISLAFAAVGLTACASMLGGDSVKIRPVDTMSGLSAVARDPLYESAVTAINSRDYARALNYLQEAKAKDQNNVKVLNALGVVYDKLGRFDLSTRYYAQARAADPQSPIVAANQGYSRVLQGMQGIGDHSAVAGTEFHSGESSVSEISAATRTREAAVRDNMERAGGQPLGASASLPSLPAGVTSGPDVKSVEGPVATASIPASVVAPALPAVARMPAVLPVSYASISTTARVDVKPRIAPKYSIVARLGTMRDSVPPQNPPADLPLPVPDALKLAVLPPVNSGSATAVVRPAGKAMLAVNAPAATGLEAKRGTVSAPNPSTSFVRAVPDTVKSAVALVVHTASVGLGAQSAEKIKVATNAPAERKPETKVEVTGARTSPERGARVSTFAINPSIALPVRARAPVNRVPPMAAGRSIVMLGKPVKILNASGRPGGIGPVSHRLAALGWSVRLSDWHMQPATTLYYPSKNIVAARAMLRTIPFPARFIADNKDTAAMRLVIGRDYLSWKPKNSRLAALWQKGAVVASLQKPITRGAH